MVTRVHSIVMEASSKEDKAYMSSMSKDDITKINGTLIQNLYGSVMQRKNIDFGDIPDSAGDIEKAKFYPNMMECITILREIYTKNLISDDMLPTLEIAISNMKKYKNQFQAGFRTKHAFIITTYNTLCLAINDLTSHIITVFMDYLVTPNETPYGAGNRRMNQSRGAVVYDSLKKFNESCKNDNFGKTMDYILEEQRKNFAGETVIIGGVIIAAILSIVPLIREIIFFYYHSRVRLSDYLNMQADFLEMNKLAVQASTKSPSEKKAIIKKQDAVIKKMRRRADKIQINDVDTNDVVKKEIKNENSLWSLPHIETQLSKNKMEGNSFSIM